MVLASCMDGLVKINALVYLRTWLTLIDLFNSSFTFPSLTVRYPSSDCYYHISRPLAHCTEGLSYLLKVDVSKGGQFPGLLDPLTYQ